MVTKIFFINWILILTVAGVDRLLLNDGIENGKFGNIPVFIFGVWALVSLLSIPAWFIYLILSF